MKYLLIALTLLGCGFAYAQFQPTGQPVEGVPVIQSTVNGSATITTGNTFQTLLASVIGTTTHRSSLTIQNNNTNGDLCWVYIGSGSAITPSSVQLSQGSSYGRYWPFVPSDIIKGTCATAGDSLYVDTQ